MSLLVCCLAPTKTKFHFSPGEVQQLDELFGESIKAAIMPPIDTLIEVYQADPVLADYPVKNVKTYVQNQVTKRRREQYVYNVFYCLIPCRDTLAIYFCMILVVSPLSFYSHM